MINWVNLLGFIGLIFGAFGPLLVILVNMTEIWRYKTDTEQLDQLKQARNQVLNNTLSPDDPEFKSLYPLIREDLPPIDEIDVIGSGVAYGGSTVDIYCKTREDSNRVMPKNEFEQMVATQMQELRDRGREWFFLCGMGFLAFGFLLQAFTYFMQNPVVE